MSSSNKFLSFLGLGSKPVTPELFQKFQSEVKITGNTTGIFQLENSGIAAGAATQIVLTATIAVPQKIKIKKILAQAVLFPFVGGVPITQPGPVFLQISQVSLAYPIYSPPAEIVYVTGSNGFAASYIFATSQGYLDCDIDMLGGQTYTINARVSQAVAAGDVNSMYVTFQYE
jgi:hypothetical protein